MGRKRKNAAAVLGITPEPEGPVYEYAVQIRVCRDYWKTTFEAFDTPEAAIAHMEYLAKSCTSRMRIARRQVMPWTVFDTHGVASALDPAEEGAVE